MIDLGVAQQKETELAALLAGMESVLVSFSGGVDSSYLLKIAVDTLGSRAVAATGLSQTYAAEEMAEARTIAREIGAEHELVDTAELTDPRYAEVLARADDEADGDGEEPPDEDDVSYRRRIAASVIGARGAGGPGSELGGAGGMTP